MAMWCLRFRSATVEPMSTRSAPLQRKRWRERLCAASPRRGLPAGCRLLEARSWKARSPKMHIILSPDPSGGRVPLNGEILWADSGGPQDDIVAVLCLTSVGQALQTKTCQLKTEL